jgi:hypothetical protein
VNSGAFFWAASGVATIAANAHVAAVLAIAAPTSARTIDLTIHPPRARLRNTWRMLASGAARRQARAARSQL